MGMTRIRSTGCGGGCWRDLCLLFSPDHRLTLYLLLSSNYAPIALETIKYY